ncbi:MAG: VWA domain-containing protein [Bryobacterales bacterium]|nr:VWA domain-containing protein [Bryobacterales bacterium]
MRRSLYALAIFLILAGAAYSQFKPLKPNPADRAKPPASEAQDAIITDSGAIISMDVQVVNILASVRDRKGKFVSDLSKENFVLKEDGKPQEIRYFSAEANLPLTLGLIIDVSVSQENLIEEEKRSAQAFIEHVIDDNDLAFVITFGPDTRLEQDLTSSRRLLTKSLQNVQVRGAAYSPVTPGTNPNSVPRGTVLFDAVYLAANEILRPTVGRKALVLITDGIDQGSKVDINAALREAQLSDVVVYSILHYDMGFYGPFSLGTADYDLGKMARETGGTLFKPKRNQPLSEIFQAIQDELRNQYSIGYTPTNSNQDGSFRQIDLSTAQKGLKVQTRRGYYAVKDR